MDSFSGFYSNLYSNLYSGLYFDGLSSAEAVFGSRAAGKCRSSGVSGAYASFMSALQKALEGRTFRERESVVMSFPPSRAANYHVDESKERSEMTLDEYKRYLCNKITELPVSGSTRLNCQGTLVLKEEAFVNMQKDPAYEERILTMLRERLQTQYPFYAPNFSCQIIGGSEAECRLETVPVKSGSLNFFGKEESWWERRHARMEDYLEAGLYAMPGDYLKIGQYKYAGAGNDLTAGRYGADGREQTEERVSLPERLEANRESRRQARLLARGGQSDQAGGVMDFSV